MIIFLIGFISGALAMLLYCHLHYDPLIDSLLKKNHEMKERSANAGPSREINTNLRRRAIRTRKK
jgi:hypothetical protein